MDDSMLDALSLYEEKGYHGSFRPDRGAVRCLSCHGASSPSEVRLEALHRVEGASDPADAAAVVALVCPACGERGTMVLPFGSTAPEGQILRDLDDHRGHMFAPGQ